MIDFQKQRALADISGLITEGEYWFHLQGFQPFNYQKAAWEAYLSGYSGLINAPTGSGKTFSLLVPIILEGKVVHRYSPGIKSIWITPIRSLGREIKKAACEAINGLGSCYSVEIRTGDTEPNIKTKIKQYPPDLLITTPESLSLLLSYPHSEILFKNLCSIVVDEWHELLGNKRGVMLELALAKLRSWVSDLKIWGISATIGNLDVALQVLVPTDIPKKLICAGIEKKIEVKAILPHKAESYDWGGHLGIKMIEEVLPLIQNSKTTLIFTNTRAQSEIWYQRLLDLEPELAGVMAIHHGSLDKTVRSWVEESLDKGSLKVVVATSSLDLGVDFRAVETVIQIGGTKGIARFLQRAGRSGHSPGALSSIYFVPTHSLELLESAALKIAVVQKLVEPKIPLFNLFDVLLQHIVTIACGDGVDPLAMWREIKTTYAYHYLAEEDWNNLWDFLCTGGSLDQYPEYKRLVRDRTGKWRLATKGMIQRHRMHIGTIVSDHSLTIKYINGAVLGTVEEWFISQLKVGDVFWFAGRALEYVRLKDNDVFVKRSKSQKGKIPAWMGGRLPLSSPLASIMRDLLNSKEYADLPEIQALQELFDIQKQLSHLPGSGELLIEYYKTREGYHLVMFPFEGRMIHEGLASLLAYRLSKSRPMSFSLSMNDYGFELLSNHPIVLDDKLDKNWMTTSNLRNDIFSSANISELAKRKFRDIASISGLIFKGYLGKIKRDKYLQSSSQMLFQVFRDYDPNNLLFQQAFEEVLQDQLQEDRLRNCLDRIQSAEWVHRHPPKITPLAFPVMVERLRERLSNEQLEKRILQMKLFR